MKYLLAHGTANDFVVIADMADELELSAELVRALCDRRTGLGADGVLRITADADGHDVFMDYRNADGSIAEMCGNGVRVVAKVALDEGLIPTSDALVIGTRGGAKPVTVTRGADGTVTLVRVDMGPPILAPSDVPFLTDNDAVADGVSLDVDGTVLTISAVSMGNPHAIMLVEDVAKAPVDTIGPKVETHARFPKGVNVEFAHVVDDTHVDLRVWERGVGETAACGTGACATVVALQRLNLVGTETQVTVPGGTLKIEYDPHVDESVYMTGPAAIVARGDLDKDWLLAASTATATE